MPRATRSVDTERVELKSCPGGFVELRQMSYGEFLKRREMAAQMEIESSKGKTRQDEARSIISMMARQTSEFEFKSCIVDHNLEDDNGNELDFSKSATIDILDPRVGEEINTHIERMNQFTEDDEGN